MIDDKKLKEAAQAYLNKWIDDNTYNKKDSAFTVAVNYPQRHKEIDELNMEAFKEGVFWALTEFKKSLWHDTEEKPKRYDDYFVKTKQGCADICYFDAVGWVYPKTGGGDVAMWLDLKDILPMEDILPTKGGKE